MRSRAIFFDSFDKIVQFLLAGVGSHYLFQACIILGLAEKLTKDLGICFSHLDASALELVNTKFCETEMVLDVLGLDGTIRNT